MKKFIICAFTALLTATIILVCQISKVLNVSETVSEKIKSLPAATEVFSRLSDGGGDVFLVKKYNEKIGIFKNGSAEPERVLDIFVFSLPEKDRLLLDLGFTVGAESLDSVIEDYTG